MRGESVQVFSSIAASVLDDLSQSFLVVYLKKRHGLCKTTPDTMWYDRAIKETDKYSNIMLKSGSHKTLPGQPHGVSLVP